MYLVFLKYKCALCQIRIYLTEIFCFILVRYKVDLGYDIILYVLLAVTRKLLKIIVYRYDPPALELSFSHTPLSHTRRGTD